MPLLNRDRAAHSLDWRSKFNQDAIPNTFNNASAMLFDYGIEKISAECAQCFQSTFLIRAS